MNNDALFRSVQDPVERKAKLVANAEIVVQDIRKEALEKFGESAKDIFNWAGYLGSVIKELGKL